MKVDQSNQQHSSVTVRFRTEFLATAERKTRRDAAATPRFRASSRFTCTALDLTNRNATLIVTI